jgi:hypothetical protein
LIVDIPDTTDNRAAMQRFKARWKAQLQQLELWMISYEIDIE